VLDCPWQTTCSVFMASHDSTYSNTAASGNSRQHNGNVFNTNYYGVAPELTAEPSTKKGHYARQISVEKYYTGRKKEAKDLAEWMIHSSERSQGTPKQARFVICGIGGSGKTQFCCKFAQSNRAQYVSKQTTWKLHHADSCSPKLLGYLLDRRTQPSRPQAYSI
jgi:hypothetical protein